MNFREKKENLWNRSWNLFDNPVSCPMQWFASIAKINSASQDRNHEKPDYKS